MSDVGSLSSLGAPRAVARRSWLRTAAPYLAIWLLAFGLRGVYLWELHDTPLWSVLMGDADRYDAWGREIAGGAWVGDEVFYQAPLYPYFLGTLYWLFGHGIAVVRVVQIALGAASCVLIAMAGRWVFSRRVGLTAGLLLAVYPPALFFDGLVQKTVLGAFLLCLLLALLAVLCRQPRRSGLWLGAGIAWGLLVLTRENMLLLAPVLVLWIVLCQAWSDGSGATGSASAALCSRVSRETGGASGTHQSTADSTLAVHHRLSGRGRRHALAWLAVGTAMVLLPVAGRNRWVGGEWHLTTAQFGPNFYIGNNAEADGLYEPLRPGRGSPWFERIDATRLAEQAVGRTLSPREVSRYWSATTWDAIRAQPGQWAALLVQKWCLTWHVVEAGDTEDIYTHAEESRLLAGLLRVFPFGVLAPLAAVGLWTTRRRWRRLWWLYAILIVYAASVALFYVFARYRYPLVPVLVLFAAVGLRDGWRLLRRRSGGELVRCAAVAAVAAVFVQGIGFAHLFARWPNLATDGIRANTHHNLALHLQKLHADLAQITAQYRIARRLDPANAEIPATWGHFLSKRGRTADAVRLLREALRLDPYLAEAQTNLGVALWKQGRQSEAVACFRQALAIDPALLPARVDLAQAWLEQGHVPDALRLLRAGRRLHPESGRLQDLLGRAEFARGRYAAAVPALRAAVARDPQRTETRILLGVALRRDGRVRDALREWRQALRRLPAGSAKAAPLRRAIRHFGGPNSAAVTDRNGLTGSPPHGN